METIGELIKRARETKGMTQKELANEVGMAQSSISLIESGKQSPSGDAMRQIANVLGLYRMDIFGLFGYEFENGPFMNVIHKLLGKYVKVFERIAGLR